MRVFAILLTAATITGLLMGSRPLHADRAPTAAVQAEAPAPAADTWLVLLYSDADDEILEMDAFTDLNEAELAGSSTKVTIVAQMDRYQGGGDDFRGGGNWSTTRRYVIRKDAKGDGDRIVSELVADLGELDMGDPRTLVDFAQWAIRTYPAARYALILGDHGMGWPGGWSDDEPNEGSMMSLDEIDSALDQIIRKTGIGQFELIGFDACLMGQLEPISTMAPYARYAVASAELEPALGWAYGAFLRQLVARPAMTGRDLGKAIVETYIDQDWRVTNPQARRELVAEQWDEDTIYSAQEVAGFMGEDVTLAAYDLSAFRGLNVAVNDLARALATAAAQADVARARRYSQAYVTAFDEDLPSPYIDLGHFLSQLERQVDDRGVTRAAAKVRAALRTAIVTEEHGETLPGASGMSIFFPNSDLYRQTLGRNADPDYRTEAKRFAAASLWDDYLTFHYTKKPITSSPNLNVLSPRGGSQGAAPVAAPTPAAVQPAVVAPGAGDITISSLTASEDTIRLGESVTLDVRIEGDNIGYIYIYTLYYDEESGAYQTVDVDFVDAGDSREVGGVVYPEWGDEGVVEFSIDWAPVLNYITDGVDTLELAPLAADTYGSGDRDTYYSLWGTYISGDSADEREAFMQFDATGAYRGMYAYTGDTARAPRGIAPRPGDEFILEEEWLTYDSDPDGAWETYYGTTLTFGEEPFSIVLDDAAPGDYTIGIQVDDLDGNSFDEFVEVTVKK